MKLFFLLLTPLCLVMSCTFHDNLTNEKESNSVLSSNSGQSSISQEFSEEKQKARNENKELEEKDCSDAHSSADDAYTYCRRAYNSDDFEDIKYNLKKAMRSFEDAMSESEDCKCDDGYSNADDGYNFAKKGLNSDDFDEMKEYARKAKNAADDTLSSTDDCSNE